MISLINYLLLFFSLFSAISTFDILGSVISTRSCSYSAFISECILWRVCFQHLLAIPSNLSSLPFVRIFPYQDIDFLEDISLIFLIFAASSKSVAWCATHFFPATDFPHFCSFFCISLYTCFWFLSILTLLLCSINLCFLTYSPFVSFRLIPCCIFCCFVYAIVKSLPLISGIRFCANTDWLFTHGKLLSTVKVKDVYL